MSKRCLLILIMMVLLIGCRTQEVGTNTTITTDFDMRSWLPASIGETIFFSTEHNQVVFETLLKIDEVADTGQYYYYFEGDGISYSDSFISRGYQRQLVVDSNGIYDIRGDKTQVLLRLPLSQDEKWQTQLWVPNIGWLSAIATVKSVNQESISVEVVSQSLDSRWQYTIRRGEGIIDSKFHSADYRSHSAFSMRYSSPPVGFVSRFVNPQENIALYYHHSLDYYQEKLSRFSYIINRLQANQLQNYLDNALNLLAVDDIRNINLASEYTKLTLARLVDSEKVDALVAFSTYYQRAIASLNEQINTYLPHNLLHQLYNYDTQTGLYQLKSEALEQSSTASYAQLLLENGISINYVNGMVKAYPSANYMRTKFDSDGYIARQFSAMFARNTTLEQHIASDLPLNWDALAQQISALEIYLHDQVNSRLITYYGSKLVALKKLYLSPYGDDSTQRFQKFNKGVLQSNVRMSYQRALLQDYQSSFSRDLAKIVQALEANSWIWSAQYNRVIQNIGYVNTQPSERVGYDFYTEEQWRRHQLYATAPIEANDRSEISVSNTDELLKAIESNRVIHLKSGTYRLDQGVDNPHISFNMDRVIIKGVSNLSIAAEDIGQLAHITATGIAPVIQFENCQQIRLYNLRLTREDNSSETPVISFKNCSDVQISNCVIAGASKTGIRLRYADNITIVNTVFNNIQGPFAELDNVSRAIFKNCDILQIGRSILQINQSKDVQVVDCVIEKATYDSGIDKNMLVLNSADLTIINPRLADNYYDLYQLEIDGLVVK